MTRQARVFDLDQDYDSYDAVTGIDEAGRGCLAGPVVVAAVTWTPRAAARLDWFGDLGDSKVLDSATRTRLFPRVLAAARRVRVAVVDHLLIDQLNILKATLHGFELVSPRPDPTVPLLIDGNQKPPSLWWAKTVIKGDARLSPVAAAAIVAKVLRDQLMAALDARLPGYGLVRHKGYATAAHRAAIATHGASRWHRKSFRPLSEMLPLATDLDGDFLARIHSAQSGEMASLWTCFRRDYAQFSEAGASRIVSALQARGLAILPVPGSEGPNRRIVWDPYTPAGTSP